jgi:hypothetical protein
VQYFSGVSNNNNRDHNNTNLPEKGSQEHTTTSVDPQKKPHLLELQNGKQTTIYTANAVKTCPLEIQALQTTTVDPLTTLKRVFLPRRFPESVSESYKEYSIYTFFANTASSATAVLATQALLSALGLGMAAAPGAVVLNWILKDGLGQLGGVAFAGWSAARLDAEPKHWRFVSVAANIFACFLEILTPIFPHLFLPIAAVANVGKNVSWLASSATKASLHRSFVNAENMADITAKSGSQAIASGLIGMSIGLAYANVAGSAHSAVIPAMAVLSGLNLMFTHLSLRNVVLPTLNTQTTAWTAEEYITGHDQTLLPETFHHHHTSDSKTAFVRAFKPPFDSSSTLSFKLRDSTSSLQFQAITHDLTTKQFHLQVQTDGRSLPEITFLLAEEATSEDILGGYLCVYYIRRQIHAEYHNNNNNNNKDHTNTLDYDALLTEATQFWKEHHTAYTDRLTQAGWHTGTIFIEPPDVTVRVRVQQE